MKKISIIKIKLDTNIKIRAKTAKYPFRILIPLCLRLGEIFLIPGLKMMKLIYV